MEQKERAREKEGKKFKKKLGKTIINQGNNNKRNATTKLP